ncbi:enoyl-CoA hydratase/isomerase family protein [Phaeobacter sp. HF9A]|uniref:enoyl-CoA hydratase/isomerase family protein n=1 Tax=Phaeobacter sp. HF9A TaxID=2721561 RepID=UPI0014312F2C|nr:enoyl-CoA hydratase/isomerase family protein [Phaeobacter sp. HF9A]NIZ14651.1 enoyl-CoA hydratase/isomerase family protein [Phaeobacter sp. HF9A]
MERDEWLNRRLHGDGVVELQLGHAPDNRLTAEFLHDFEQEIIQMSEDDSIRGILLTSPFRDFCAGLPTELEEDADPYAQLDAAFLALYTCPKPVVCATLGLCSGLGMFFVLASDIRVAHARAGFEMVNIQSGQGYSDALMEIAKATLDSNTQRRLMLTGQRLGPIAARNAQFIEIIADDLEDLHGYALKEVRKLATLAPEVYTGIKHALRRDTIARIEARLDAGLTLHRDQSRLAS